MNNRKLTKEETSIVIIIVLIVSALCLLPLLSSINKASVKSYYTNVFNIVTRLKQEKTLNYDGPCIYTLTEEEYDKTNIDFLYIILHNEDNKVIYSVYSKMLNNKTTIDIYDYDDLNFKSNPKTWISENKATTKYSNIIYDKEKYNTCRNLK